MPRALIVDDNAINRKLLTRMLHKMGWASFEAANGALAVSAYKKDSFPLVLMDIQMPVMDGITAAVKIQEHFPLGDGPPIVAMTASALEDERLEYKEAGFDGVILKPFSKQEMLRILNTHLT